MRWAPTAIAGYAKQAGFRDDPLTVAVALALAGTGGDDLARVVTIPPTGYDQRGLWLVDVLAYPEWATVDLYDPRVNAAAAQTLYTVAGGVWDWSPVYLTGAWRDLCDVAAAAAKQADVRQPLGYGAETIPGSRTVIAALNDLGRALPPPRS